MLYLLMLMEVTLFSVETLGQGNLSYLHNPRDKYVKGATYVGCFEPHCQTEGTIEDLSGHNGSIYDSCVKSCRDKNLVYSAIRGVECNCSREFSCSKQSALNDVKCGLPCKGNVHAFCGGRPAISVYKVKCLDSCQDRNNTKGGNISYSLITYVAATVAGGTLIFAITGCLMCVSKRRSKSERPSAEGRRNADLIDTDHSEQSPSEPSTIENGPVAASTVGYNRLENRFSLPPTPAARQDYYYEIGEGTSDESPTMYHVLEGENDDEPTRGKFKIPMRRDRTRKGENGYVECHVQRGTFERKTASLCLNAFNTMGSAQLYSVVKK